MKERDQGVGPRRGREPFHGSVWRNRILFLTLGAVVFRLVLFMGRGDYLAFDEGWYLLLGRSLFTGEGYSLIGIPHITLSPLFPIFAGGAGNLLGSWVWGGRLVAALASGLLILPLWAIFRRLTSPRTAFTAAALVAVLPCMAPFMVPFYVGADLWVGAEPLLHLFLFTGVHFWLRADDEGGLPDQLLSGLAFGLAFLARPEAIITWGLLGLWALGRAVLKRAPRRLMGAAVMGLGFILVGVPYWSYLHGVTGAWGLTGRGINPASNAARMVSGGERGGSSSTIESMLWGDDDAYARRLYGLDASGLVLRSDYWGVDPRGGAPSPGSPAPTALPESGRSESPPVTRTTGDTASPSPLPSPPVLFAHAMGTLFPGVLWVFVLLGVLGPRGPGMGRKEVPVVLSLVGTSLAIALLVAVDPRTQLFLVPLMALYAAKGFGNLEDWLGPWLKRLSPRPRFLEGLLVFLTVAGLMGINLTRLYLALSLGSPHHLVATQNRLVAQELDSFLGPQGGPVASFHPAIAIYADRDWRVLPFTEMPGIIRYAQASGAEAVVISAYYPPFRGEEILGTRYLILPIPPVSEGVENWEIVPVEGDSIRGLARLREGS